MPKKLSIPAGLPQPIPVVSAADLEILREVINDYRSRRVNAQIRSFERDEHQAPEFYVARPVQAIPALTDAVFTGTGSDLGEGDVPGSGLCDIYRLLGDGTLDRIAIHQTVYNLSLSEISVGWIQITRDKFGKWWALTPGSGGSGVITVRFMVIEKINNDPGICRCYIESRPCNVNAVPEEVNGVITIYDFAGCNFNEPADHLRYRKGWANYMKSVNITSGTGTQQSGTGTIVGSCNWEVETLCCP